VGVAVLGGLFYAALGSRSDPAAVTHAFSVTLVAIAGCHVGGALLAAGLGQHRPAPLALPSPATCPNAGH
jgi:hypothetical protein